MNLEYLRKKDKPERETVFSQSGVLAWVTHANKSHIMNSVLINLEGLKSLPEFERKKVF
jgi:hypothetical protein